jgi:hypothetical protein
LGTQSAQLRREPPDLGGGDDGHPKTLRTSDLEDSLQVIIEVGLCKAPAGKICQLDAEGDDAVGLEFMKRIAQLSIAEGAIQLLSRDD